MQRVEYNFRTQLCCLLCQAVSVELFGRTQFGRTQFSLGEDSLGEKRNLAVLINDAG
jgi:hypothetical protein